jgi:hypothetical protein
VNLGVRAFKQEWLTTTALEHHCIAELEMAKDEANVLKEIMRGSIVELFTVLSKGGFLFSQSRVTCVMLGITRCNEQSPCCRMVRETAGL